MTLPSIKKLREALRRRPGDAAAWVALGEAARGAGDLLEAREAYLRAAELAPDWDAGGRSLGDVLFDLGALADAERAFRAALAREPGRVAARTGLARCLLANGREQEAMKEIAAGLRDDPRFVPLRLLVATWDETRGALAEAADHLAAVLAVDSEHPEANQRLAGVLEQLGDLSGAVRCWRRVVATTVDDGGAVETRLGIALSRDGQHTEAIRVLEAIAARGQNSGAWANLGMALLTASRLDEAVGAFERTLALDRTSAQAHCGIGLAHMRRGSWREAARAFEITTELAPDNVVGAYNLGLALDALGDREGARRALLRAAALDPDDEEIRLALEELMARDAVPRPVTKEEPSIPLSIKGSLKSFQLFDVLEFLRLQTKTGSLVLSSRQGVAAIRLVKGSLTSATAPGIKRLGEALVERGLVRRVDLDRLLARQREKGADAAETLGRLLLEHKLVDRQALAKVVLDQVMASLDEVSTWTEGSFSFHPAEETEVPPVVFDLQEVMLEFLRASDERKHAMRVTSR